MIVMTKKELEKIKIMRKAGKLAIREDKKLLKELSKH